MKEIIEKWASCYIRYGCKTESDEQETNEDLLNLLRMIEKQEEAKAMEKQPTEYEYEKVEFDKAWVAAKVHEERDMELWRQSDLNDAINGNNWKAIQSPSEAAQYHFDLYRRIELTPEQLHERKVEELAGEFHDCDVELGHVVNWCKLSEAEKTRHIVKARKALEWMESKE